MYDSFWHVVTCKITHFFLTGHAMEMCSFNFLGL